jgi:hypothetical protein
MLGGVFTIPRLSLLAFLLITVGLVTLGRPADVRAVLSDRA